MTSFTTKALPTRPDTVAPDGSDVRILADLAGGSMIHVELAAGRTSRAVAHHTVEEMWFVLSGEGEMWRSRGGESEIVALRSGVGLTIPLATHFQFRATGPDPLRIVVVTMPPWPGGDEAFPVQGPWDHGGTA